MDAPVTAPTAGDATHAKSLALAGVSKHFGGINAVDDVTLHVPAGTITGLIGPNGAGKTTLVNLITGVFALSAGSIRFGGIDLTQAPRHEVARAGIARTFQTIRLLGDASVLDNIVIGMYRHAHASILAQALNLRASRQERRRLRDEAHALLARFGMTRYADHPARTLSYGDQRRVEMMRALAMRPSMLLLDEPVAGMNDVEGERIGEIFQSLARDGLGILLIEHNIRFVRRLCDRLYALDAGRIIAQGTPDEVVADPAVVLAYLGEDEDA